jgi:hypothetical protein
MDRLQAFMRSACRVYSELPCYDTSAVSGGDGVRFFGARTVNTFQICPRLSDGTCAVYVTPADVCVTVTDAAARPVHVHTQLRLDSGSGTVSIAYTFDAVATGYMSILKEVRVRVHVCGALLVDACVARKTFSGRTGGRLYSQHIVSLHYSPFEFMAIHPAGTYMAISDYANANNRVNVFALPDFQLVGKLGQAGAGLKELRDPRGLCFTSAGALLVADNSNRRVQCWALDGTWIESYSVENPWCVASYGDMVAVGCDEGGGVCIISLESGTVIHKWLNGSNVTAVAFVNADTSAIAISNYTAVKLSIDLYTLEGVLKTHLVDGIISLYLAACTDGCLLAQDWYGHHVRVFSQDGRSGYRICVFLEDGTELGTSTLATHTFEAPPRTIAVHAEHAYVLGKNSAGESCIYVFD